MSLKFEGNRIHENGIENVVFEVPDIFSCSSVLTQFQWLKLTAVFRTSIWLYLPTTTSKLQRNGIDLQATPSQQFTYPNYIYSNRWLCNTFWSWLGYKKRVRSMGHLCYILIFCFENFSSPPSASNLFQSTTSILVSGAVHVPIQCWQSHAFDWLR